jgi:1A family penicillin-binding protein
MKLKSSHRSNIRRPAYGQKGGRIGNLIAAYRRLPLWKKIFVVLWPTVILLAFIAAVTTISFAGALGSKDALMNRNNTGVTLLDRNGKAFYAFNDAHNDTYVQLKDVAPIAQKAVVSSEDKDFYKHPGFSLIGIGNAVYQNLLHAGGAGGGSTLTQQLVKNALLSQERSIFRKYQELILSIEVERRYSKDEILEMYLNSAYFGEGAFGIEDAARTYFGKSAKDLDNAQAAMLIGLLPAPSAYSPISGDAHKAKVRQEYVLERMKEDGVLNGDQALAAENEQLSYQPAKTEEAPDAPHFALMVKQWLEDKYGEEKVARSGYKVTTTLDLDAQSKAQTAVENQVNRLASSKVGNGSAVVMDPRNGEVLALVGSVDWSNNVFGKVNMATAARQPGSSFKPFVYATGIQNRQMTGATIFSDTPQTYGTYQPKNYDLKYRGDVTLRRALSNSLNIPAVEAMQKVGINNVIQNAKAAGLTTLDKTADEYGLPLALGSGQAKLVEMTGAYSAFANEGNHAQTQLVLNIVNKDKQKIYDEKVSSNSVWSSGTAFIISNILSDNSARSEIFGSSLTVSSNRPVAVKTGTTENYRDAWTIGYTPSLAIGVWIGNNDNSQMSSVAGSSGSGPIWVNLMRQLLADKPVEKFNQPSTVVSHDICRNNGALAQTSGSNTYNEYFLSGTLPTATCNEAKQQEQKKEDTSQSQQQETPKQDTTDPTAPTGLTATPGVASISLSWNASTDDTGVTGYKIYRNGSVVATVTTPTYKDAGLTPLTKYNYYVIAVDAAGNASQQSSTATATTTADSGGGSGGTTPNP